MTETTHHTFCRICEALCGLEVTVAENRVTAIRPDADHVATSGFACLKGLEQHRLYASPDPLRSSSARTERRQPGCAGPCAMWLTSIRSRTCMPFFMLWSARVNLMTAVSDADASLPLATHGAVRHNDSCHTITTPMRRS